MLKDSYRKVSDFECLLTAIVFVSRLQLFNYNTTNVSHW